MNDNWLNADCANILVHSAVCRRHCVASGTVVWSTVIKVSLQQGQVMSCPAHGAVPLGDPDPDTQRYPSGLVVTCWPYPLERSLHTQNKPNNITQVPSVHSAMEWKGKLLWNKTFWPLWTIAKYLTESLFGSPSYTHHLQRLVGC